MEPPNRFRPLAGCGSRRSADLAGTSVALSGDIPVLFDGPLAAHHKSIGPWAASRETSARICTRPEARRHIERVFDAAVHEILDPIELADFRIAVLHGEEHGAPAIFTICENIGQLDLGWIETGDAPISWRAAAYRALEQSLHCALPISSYQDLFDELAMYYWDGETEDEAARHCLTVCHGLTPEEIDEQALPSDMNARRPEWMIGGNAAPLAQLPRGLRLKLRALAEAHKALKAIQPEESAWHYDIDVIHAYIPGIEECSTFPPLTLVPFEQFARELDDVARSAMEMGFMDIVGACLVQDAHHVEDWFASLRIGARFLLAAQDLIQFDPANPGGCHVRP